MRLDLNRARRPNLLVGKDLRAALSSPGERAWDRACGVALAIAAATIVGALLLDDTAHPLLSRACFNGEMQAVIGILIFEQQTLLRAAGKRGLAQAWPMMFWAAAFAITFCAPFLVSRFTLAWRLSIAAVFILDVVVATRIGNRWRMPFSSLPHLATADLDVDPDGLRADGHFLAWSDCRYSMGATAIVVVGPQRRLFALIPKDDLLPTQRLEFEAELGLRASPVAA